MRILHFQRNKGNLESINALLGCAIFIPKLQEANNIFDMYTEEQACKVLDILVYTVNWMRVSISAFVTQDDPMIRGKVRNFFYQVRIGIILLIFCVLGFDTSYTVN